MKLPLVVKVTVSEVQPTHNLYGPKKAELPPRAVTLT